MNYPYNGSWGTLEDKVCNVVLKNLTTIWTGELHDALMVHVDLQAQQRLLSVCPVFTQQVYLDQSVFFWETGGSPGTQSWKYLQLLAITFISGPSWDQFVPYEETLWSSTGLSSLNRGRKVKGWTANLQTSTYIVFLCMKVVTLIWSWKIELQIYLISSEMR